MNAKMIGSPNPVRFDSAWGAVAHDRLGSESGPSRFHTGLINGSIIAIGMWGMLFLAIHG